MKQTDIFTNVRKAHRQLATDTWAQGNAALDFVDNKIFGSTNFWRLSEQAQRFVTSVRSGSLLGNGLPLANRAVREASGRAMISTLMVFAHEYKFLREGNERLRMLTIKPPTGFVDIRSPSFPAELAKLSAKRMMRGKALQGLGHLDLALFSASRGQPERNAHIHSHVAATFKVEKKWVRGDWVSELAPASGNVNPLDDSIVDISSKGNNKRPRLAPKDVAGLAYYNTKETAGASTIYQSIKGQKSESSHTDWTFAGALRQLEFWSYVDALRACWSQGVLAGHMRTYWRTELLRLLDYCELPTGQINFSHNHENWKQVWHELDSEFVAINPDTVIASSERQRLNAIGLLR